MLTLTGISKSYGDQQGVRDIDMTAPAAGKTVIVGPSGSGKTTLLRLIAGFETPDAGTIALAGRALHAVPPHRRNIAYVAQEGALFPHMSVADNIGFAMPRRATHRQERIDDLLARVGLPTALRSRRPHELSGGQQQRVALARALAQQPALMLLDEPFSALDAGLREAVRTMVDEVLRAAGIASILVTHDQAEALAFADQLIVMREARIVDAGPPRRLYERPKNVDTARFFGRAIILPAEIRDGVAHTALGPIDVEVDRAASAMVLVRPEQLMVERLSGSASGTEGTVVKRFYQGASWQVQLDCRGIEQPIALDVPSHNDWMPGNRVSVAVKGMGHVLEHERGQGTVST